MPPVRPAAVPVRPPRRRCRSPSAPAGGSICPSARRSIPRLRRGRRAAGSGAERGYPPTIGRSPSGEAIAWMARRFGVASTPRRCVRRHQRVRRPLPQWLKLRTPERDTVLFPEVAYPTYEMGAILAGCRPAPVPLRRTAASTWQRSSDDDADRALALWVNSPGNPTGEPTTSARPRWGRARDVPVFSDECYVEFTWAGATRTILAARPRRGGGGALALERSNLAGARASASTRATPTSSLPARCASTWFDGARARAGRRGGAARRRRPRRRAARALLPPARARQRDLGVGPGAGSDDLPPGRGSYPWARAQRRRVGPRRALAGDGGAIVSPGEFYGQGWGHTCASPWCNPTNASSSWPGAWALGGA